jgi:uncharacterized protein
MRTNQLQNALHLEPRSVLRYVVGVVVLGIAVLAVPVVMDQPTSIAVLFSLYFVLLGGAMLMARRSGPGGIRRLFSGLLHWRIGFLNWVFVVAALPAATVGVAIVTGKYQAPADGWLPFLGDYLFQTFIFGALVVNLWEETAWNGLVQRNLTRSYGWLRGAVLTAIPFTAFHIPLSFENGKTLSEAAFATTMTFIAALSMRFIVGRLDRVTGGSLLAVGIFHAAFNASAKLDVVDGELQYVAAIAIIAALTVGVEAIRSRSGVESRGDADHVASSVHEVAISK